MYLPSPGLCPYYWNQSTYTEEPLHNRSADHTLRLWDVDAAASLGILKGHTWGVTGVQILTGGRVAVTNFMPFDVLFVPFYMKNHCCELFR